MLSSPHRALPGEAHREVALSVDRPLTVPLLIRGSFDNSLFGTLLVIVLLLLIAGLYGLIRERSIYPMLICWGIAAAAGVPAAVLGLWLRLRREWLEVTLTGFVL